jgi:DNA-binding XRE family transcriptional regulator
MPDVPTALPDKAKVRALIKGRGYQIDGFARNIGVSPWTLYAITGRQRRTSLKILRRIAAGLSTTARPVRLSDICDWDGPDDIESDAETKIPA